MDSFCLSIKEIKFLHRWRLYCLCQPPPLASSSSPSRLIIKKCWLMIQSCDDDEPSRTLFPQLSLFPTSRCATAGNGTVEAAAATTTSDFEMSFGIESRNHSLISFHLISGSWIIENNSGWRRNDPRRLSVVVVSFRTKCQKKITDGKTPARGWGVKEKYK